MKPQRLLDVAAVDELVYLAVGIAGDIAEDRVTRWRLVSLWIGMMGNCFTAQLSGMLWKKRKVAEIRVGEQTFQPFQLLGK